MDLKIKGISWAGNFYQKFEKMCNEVDSIVNQDAVKYVGNQVQSVGGNMKKFYTEVISDILPPSVSSVKHDPQEKSLEKTAAVDTYIESEMGIEDNSIYRVNEHSHFQPSEFGPIVKQVDRALSGLHVAEELNPLTFMDPLEAVDSDQGLRQIANALTKSHPNLKFEENTVTKNFCFDDDDSELTSPKVEDWFGDALWDTFVECDDEFPCQLQDGSTVATSVLREEFQSNDNAKMVNSDASSEKNTVDAVDSRISSPVMESCLLENPNETSATFVDIAGFSSHNMFPSPPSTTTLSTENNVSEKKLISSSSVLSSDLPDSLSSLRCTEIKSSVVTSEENKAENADVSNRSPLRESLLLENTRENTSPLAESCHSSVDVARCVSHSALTTTTFSERVSEMGLMSSSIFESSESIGPLDVSDHEVNSSSMETIDLCDDVKLEDSSNYVDNNALYDVSRTLRKHRSYKQILRDAFTSKKRLVKEYEQLAIWFGDADMGSNKQSEQQRPLTFTTTMGSKDLQAETDFGWEVL